MIIFSDVHKLAATIQSDVNLSEGDVVVRYCVSTIILF